MNIRAVDNNLSLKGRFMCTDIINESLENANRREILRFSHLLERMKEKEDLKKYALFEKRDDLLNKSKSRVFVLKEMHENKEIFLFEIRNKTRLAYSKILSTLNENLAKLYPKVTSKKTPISVYKERIKSNMLYDKPKQLLYE